MNGSNMRERAINSMEMDCQIMGLTSTSNSNRQTTLEFNNIIE